MRAPPENTCPRARFVLNDARLAFDELRSVSAAGGDRALYRRRWIAVVTLLRAVGHVLEKVDGGRSGIHRDVIAEWWDRPKPPIFADFIKNIRDLTVKQYRTGLFNIMDPKDSPMSLIADDASAMADSFSVSGLDPLTGRGFLEFVFRDGPFAGLPVNEVIDDAIEWWSQYLDEIEAEITRLLSAPSRA